MARAGAELVRHQRPAVDRRSLFKVPAVCVETSMPLRWPHGTRGAQSRERARKRGAGNSDLIASVMGPADPERQKRAQQIVTQVRARMPPRGCIRRQRQEVGKKMRMQNGAAIYAGSCAICHGAPNAHRLAFVERATPFVEQLAVAPRARESAARDLARYRATRCGERGPSMPGFYGAFNDEQVAASYPPRATYTDRPAMAGREREVAQSEAELRAGRE